MHTLSLPPSDRAAASDTRSDTALRAELLRLRRPVAEGGESLSNSIIAAGCGKSETMISQYLNDKYPGDVAGLEVVLCAWLRDRQITRASGIATIETDITRTVARKLEEIRLASELGVITGPAGIGKSRAEALYLKSHPVAISFRAIAWHCGINALAYDLCQAASIFRLGSGQKRWDVVIEKTTGSGRLLIIDDAHELSQRALQCAVDYHEETGNPVALVGLPALKRKLLRDDRRARRVGDFYELAIKDPSALVEHLVSTLAPDANGERADLVKLATAVATGPGAFGALEKQLKYAARSRRKKPDVPWPAAFRAAHLRLLRSYTLN